MSATEDIAFTRGGSGSFTQESDLVACETPNDEDPLIDDFCFKCKAARLGGTLCNSCAPCPNGTAGMTAINRDNVMSGFSSSCATEDDDVVMPVATFSGALCSFEAVTAGRCELDRFCGLVEAGFSHAGGLMKQ